MSKINIPVPGLKNPHGLGDIIKAATSAVGIKPCGGCNKRATILNNAISFGGPQGPKEASVPLLNVEGERAVWTKPPEVPPDWTLVKECGKGRAIYRFFRYGYQRFVIWCVEDDEYAHSISFAAVERAEKKFNQLCSR